MNKKQISNKLQVLLQKESKRKGKEKNMNLVKKLLTIVIALVMMLGLGVTAMADDTDPSGETPAEGEGSETTDSKNDSITVNGVKAGESYSIYKMFDLDVNSETNPTAYTYTVNSDWAAFFKAAEGETPAGPGREYVTINNAGAVTEINNPAALAKAAAEWSGKPAAKDTVEVGDGESSVVFSGLEDGYWLITSTLGTIAMTETTPDKAAVTVNEKNHEDNIIKQVQEDSTTTWATDNDAQIGDVVNYQVTITLVPGTRNVVFHDVMDPGLTYLDDAAIEGLTDGNEYTLGKTGDDTFTITFDEDYINSLTGTAELKLTYTAVLNKDAIVNGEIVPQTNKGVLNYGDKSSVEQNTETTTHSFTVKKHNSADELLEGAVFELKKNGTVLSLTKIDEYTYMVDPNGTEVAFTTKADKVITILGVDSDSDYTLNETEQPDGYNILTSEVEVEVNKTNSFEADVLNQSGSELPSTGGMGTTLFYIAGTILVATAGILLVSRRRMSE